MISIIPTNTCYGIGCPAHDLEAFAEIYRIKDRSRSKALALLVSDMDAIGRYIEILPKQLDDLSRYPHPWSIVGKLRSDAPLPNEIKRDPLYKTISLRTVIDAVPESIRSQITPPLWLTSANRSGESESHTIDEVKRWILQSDAHENGVVYLDGGICDGLGSDIFSYIGEGLEKHYFRKNYL